MIPASRPAASTTGSRLSPRAYISAAACSTVSRSATVTAGLVIRSPAVTPAALRRSVRWAMGTTIPRQAWYPSCRASLASMSASETTPMTLPSPSTTGNPLTADSNILAASSLNGESLVTEIG